MFECIEMITGKVKVVQALHHTTIVSSSETDFSHTFRKGDIVHIYEGPYNDDVRYKILSIKGNIMKVRIYGTIKRISLLLHRALYLLKEFFKGEIWE